jgi:AcrR family transcriptional regulator
MAAMPTRQRALRKEAVQNRQRLLIAAKQVFAMKGTDAAVDEIARVAGVGMGTLYRHFPTKQALIDELVSELRQRLLYLGRKAALKGDGLGLETLLVDAGRAQARDPGYMQFLWSRSDAGRAFVDEFLQLLSDLVDQAKAAGRVRSDLSVTDVWMTLWSLRSIVEMTRTRAPAAWHRHVELLIAGMRPDPSGERPLSARPMTPAEAQRCIDDASR